MNFPKSLLYSLDYLWAEIKGKEAIIGIIGLAAKESKEFAYINLPKKGSRIKKGQTLLSLEAVKWTGSIKSPLTGEVTDVNMKAYNEPSVINSKPFETWIVKMKIENEDELKELLSSQKALKHYENK